MIELNINLNQKIIMLPNNLRGLRINRNRRRRISVRREVEGEGGVQDRQVVIENIRELMVAVEGGKYLDPPRGEVDNNNRVNTDGDPMYCICI